MNDSVIESSVCTEASHYFVDHYSVTFKRAEIYAVLSTPQ